MIEYDEIENKMVLKLVYYGPALSGKTTNLLRLHDMLERSGRGDLMVLDTTDDRTIFFDLIPFFFTAPSGLKIKVKIYTVPGQVRHDATRKAVLQRADGVAFIADSREAERENNSESFRNLEKNIGLVGLDMERLPLVIQFNKRDLPDITGEDEIRRVWGPSGIPIVLASALEGWGVIETLGRLAGLTYEALDGRFRLGKDHGMGKDDFLGRLTNMAKERDYA